MRKVIDLQMEFWKTDIADIEFDLQSRDEVPKLLMGLQYIHCTAPISLNEQDKLVWAYGNVKRQRKQQVLILKDKGWTNKEVANDLGCSVQNVGQIVKHPMTMTGQVHTVVKIEIPR